MAEVATNANVVSLVWQHLEQEVATLGEGWWQVWVLALPPCPPQYQLCEFLNVPQSWLQGKSIGGLTGSGTMRPTP